MKPVKKTHRLLLPVLLAVAMLPARAQLLDPVALDTVKIFRSLELALEHPDQVYKLELTRQKYTRFPPEILKFRNLNSLDLSKNKIKFIPPEINRLKCLQELNLSRNKLTQWQIGICELKHLRELNLSRNFIGAIPPQIEQLTELRRLDLWSNELSVFPPELKKLTQLVWMDLRVIMTNKETQDRIRSYVPNARVYFDPPCACNF